jgi:hypothetical protein
MRKILNLDGKSNHNKLCLEKSKRKQRRKRIEDAHTIAMKLLIHVQLSDPALPDGERKIDIVFDFCDRWMP